MLIIGYLEIDLPPKSKDTVWDVSNITPRPLDNSLSILTSSIHNIKEMKKNSIDDSLKDAEKLLNNENLDDH